MITCTQIIRRALVKLAVLPARADAEPSELEDGLWALQSLYTGWINGGAFGRARDVYVDSDYTAQEGDRIRCADGEFTITLPDTYPDTDPPDSRPGLVTNLRPPLDRAFVIVNDGEETVTHLYDRYLGRWVAVEDLDLNSEAPLANKDREGLACCLALELAGDYSVEPGSSVIVRARAYKALLTHGYGSPQTQAELAYF